MTWWQILLIVLAVLSVIAIALYFYGRKIQSQTESQQSLIDQSKMVTKLLIIDKKKMKVKDSNLPQMVQDQIPWYFKWQKLPLVKAKVGPKIQTFICDGKIFDEIPLKKTLKVEIAGLYIVSIKSFPKGYTPEKKAKKSWMFWK